MKHVFFLLIILLFCSCKKDSFSITGHWQCNLYQQTDSTAIINKLSGSWIWKTYACGDNGKVHPADKTVKTTFNTNGTFTVIENAVIVTQGTWGINIVDTGAYGLHLSQPSIYLYGRILFCDDQVLFNDSYVDGCDYLFTKSN